MKKLIKYCVVFLLLFLQCKEENPNEIKEPPIEENKGELVLKSLPSGAKIFLLGTETGDNTPKTYNLEVGSYDIMFRHQDYFDTSFQVEIHKNLTTTKDITLISKITPTVHYEVGPYVINFFVRFNYSVLLNSVTITRPNQEIEYEQLNRMINKDTDSRFADYLISNGNVRGTWKFLFIGYMQGNQSHTFEKEKTIIY